MAAKPSQLQQRDYDTMAKRNKVVSNAINKGILTITYYTPPSPEGQTAAGSLQVDFTENQLPIDVMQNLAAVGFTHVLSMRLANDTHHVEVSEVARTLHQEMAEKQWSPKGAQASKEPSALIRAIAEVMHTSVETISHDFEHRLVMTGTGEPYVDKRGRKRKFFSKPMQDRLARDPRIAPVLARLEGTKRQRPASIISDVFPAAGENT